MSLQVIKTAPDPTKWTSLADHQAATPASFSAPVLHFHCASTQIALSSDQKSLIPEFFPNEENQSSTIAVSTAQDAKDAAAAEDNNNMLDEEDEGNWEEDAGPMIQDVTIENVDVYVTNRYLVLNSLLLHTMVAFFFLANDEWKNFCVANSFSGRHL